MEETIRNWIIPFAVIVLGAFFAERRRRKDKLDRAERDVAEVDNTEADTADKIVTAAKKALELIQQTSDRTIQQMAEAASSMRTEVEEMKRQKTESDLHLGEVKVQRDDMARQLAEVRIERDEAKHERDELRIQLQQVEQTVGILQREIYNLTELRDTATTQLTEEM